MKFKLSVILITLLVIGNFLQAKNIKRFVNTKVTGKYYSNVIHKYEDIDVKLIIDRKNKTIAIYYPEKESPYYNKKANEYKDYYFILDEKGISDLRNGLQKSLKWNIKYKDNKKPYQDHISQLNIVLYWKTKEEKNWKHGNTTVTLHFVSKLCDKHGTIFTLNTMCLYFGFIYGENNSPAIAGGDYITFYFKDIKELIKKLNIK